MLVGRDTELEQLQQVYKENRFQIVIIDGDSGNGKTALVRAWCQRKKAVWFTVQAVMPSCNVTLFQKEMEIQGIHGGFKELAARSMRENRILVIEAAQRLENYFPDFTDWLKQIITEPEAMRLMVIFVSSKSLSIRGMSMYQKKIHLDALTYIDSLPFFAQFEPEEKLLLYGVTSGRPANLVKIPGHGSIREIMQTFFLGSDALFQNEGERRLREFVREPKIYHTILMAVASGLYHMQEVAAAIGMEPNKLSKYMKILVQLGFLEREVPADELQSLKQHRKTLYRFSDTQLLFWYRFVCPYAGSIDAGRGMVYWKDIQPQLHMYLAEVFDRVSIQFAYLICEKRDLGGCSPSFGFLWEDGFSWDSVTHLSVGKEKNCLVTCFWSKHKVDVPEIRMFLERHPTPKDKIQNILIFSRKGFTDRALVYSSESSNVRLVSLVYIR